MVTVSVGRDSVTIRFEGVRSFFALKSKITIPLENISKVSTQQVKPVWFPEVRLGTHIPGVFMAGTFWMRNAGKSFYYARDFSNCITLTLKAHEYSKVIVQVDKDKDKEAVAARIRNAMK